MSDARDEAGGAAARVFAALVSAHVAFDAVFLGVKLARWPVPWYFPIEHRWALASKPAGLAMGWFGATGAALAAALLVGVATWAVCVRGAPARALSRAAVVSALAGAGALVLAVDFAYFGWTAMDQAPAPWAEPACPRAP